MTNQEAIHSMNNLNDCISITESEHLSVNMAIKALEEQDRNRWIPVAERLPEEKEDALTLDYINYQCTILTLRAERIVRNLKFGSGKWWHFGTEASFSVLAWREQPLPYKEDTE